MIYIHYIASLPRHRFAEEQVPGSVLFIPRGVSSEVADEGLAELAKEIHEHFASNFPNKTSLITFLPAGTGTTAMFLHRHLHRLARLQNAHYTPTTFAVSIAMKPHHLISRLQQSYPDDPSFPEVIHPSGPRIRFAEPNARVKATWCCMKRKGLDLDLIYGPIAWMALLERLPSFDLDTAEVYYIHTGGLTGNDSQLKRYQATCNVSGL